MISARSFSETKGNQKLIALTFDDGPNTTTTVEILDVLEEYGASASFFVVGDNINAGTIPVMRRAVSMGCEIGSHSMTHSHMDSMSKEGIEKEAKSVARLISDAVGMPPKFFRAPYLEVSADMYSAIDLPFIAGYSCGDWDENVDAKTRVRKTLEQCSDGAIILLHDTKGNHQTVTALREIIPQLMAQGYEFVTVSQLFCANGVRAAAGVRRQLSSAAEVL